MADKAVNWGESVSAVCTVVSGDAPLEISWALNGSPITNDNPHISVTTTKRNSLIAIDSASPSHAGEYTCVASNGAGGTSFSAELTVNGTWNKTSDLFSSLDLPFVSAGSFILFLVLSIFPIILSIVSLYL